MIGDLCCGRSRPIAVGEGVSSKLPIIPPSKLPRNTDGVELCSNASKIGPKLSSSTIRAPFGVPMSKLLVIPGDRWKNGDGRNAIVLFDSEPTQLESRGGDRNGDFVSIDSKAFSGEDDTRGPGEGGGEGGLSSSLS